MDYSTKSKAELIALCKERNVKGYSGKKKEDLVAMLQANDPPSTIVWEKQKPYLKAFLENHKTKKGYKRIVSSPLRYAGGKTKAVGILLEHLPALKEKKIVSPFFGGGSFELALATHLGFEVIGYDVFGMLVNFWQQILSKPEDLSKALATMKPTEEAFTRNRNILLTYWEKIKPASLNYKTKNRLALTDEEKMCLDTNPLLQAAHYYYNMQLSYGPMFLGWPSNVYLKETRYKEILEKVKTFKPGKVQVSCASFEEAITKHPNDFLFLDPPYYLGGESKMFKGMYPNCNFAIHHNDFDHKKLADLLNKHKGGFLLTYNDCPEVRAFYKDFQQVFPSWQYTYGQGEKRIGKNREEGTGDNIKESHEIVIICPPKES